MKKKQFLILNVLIALIILSGCSQNDGLPLIPASINRSLNLVELLDLGESVRLEILAFDMEDVDPNGDFIRLNNITNQEKIDEIIFLLDSDLRKSPALFCIPEYRLRFWLEDGTQVELGFSCGDAQFITGEQAVFDGRQFSPPGKFSGLIQSYIDVPDEQPEGINLLKSAEFTEVVKIEIAELQLGEGSAEVNLIMVIEEMDVIEKFLLEMSGDFTLIPRVRCPVDYFITFSMEDGSSETFGYLCGGDDNGILRGDQGYFFDQDIHLGEDFVRLFEGVVSSE